MDQGLRQKRHRRIRSRVLGTAERPRASVFRGTRYISVQLIDDSSGQTLLAASSHALKNHHAKTDQAREIGKAIAQEAKKKGIAAVVFDRGGYRYHGRVRALAEAMREEGLKF